MIRLPTYGKTLPGLLPALLLAFAAMVPAVASLPPPLFSYDFRETDGGIARAIGTPALDLRAARIRDGALHGPEAATPLSQEKALDWLAAHSPDEFSASFSIRFDSLPSVGNAIGLFDVSADSKGFLTIRLFAKPTEFEGDFLMRSREVVSKGEWHHLSFTYSKLRSRATLYLDGRFQWENDCLYLPSLRFGQPSLVDGFKGAIRDLRFHDMALPRPCLTLAKDPRRRCAVLAARAKSLETKTSHAALRRWLTELERRATRLPSIRKGVTDFELEELERDISNAERIVSASRGEVPKGHGVSSPAIAFTVNPISQEPLLPHVVPKKGSLSGRIQVAATRREYENGSVLLFALRPVEIRKVTVSDLRGPQGSVIPSRNVDVKLVKRWFRTGGAWLCFHSDRRQRNLVPDLLVNDDDLIRVDEWRERNLLRLDYPEGRSYVDVSDPAKGHQIWNNDIPFKDAESLQPVMIGEAGRNQQFLFTIRIPEDAKDGLYRATVAFEGADITLDLLVRVLPIDLPAQPSTYGDLSRPFLSNVNSLPAIVGPTLADRETYAKKLLGWIRAHNLFHTSGIWDTEELIGLSLEEGLVPDKVFGRAGGRYHSGPRHDWFSLYPGIPPEELTTADKELALSVIERQARPWKDFRTKNFPDWSEPYVVFCDENKDFWRLNTRQSEQAEVAHRLGQMVQAHGSEWNRCYAGDIQDLQSFYRLEDEGHVAAWHAVGGEIINFADSFPGNENPFWFRRRVGLRSYKAGFDGEMIHGLLGGRIPWNEFASDPGGDGNYRNFCQAYPQRDGFIAKLAVEGVREAFDDLRYATRLRQLALANRSSEDEWLSRESRRQLLWLENLDAKTTDPTTARLAIIRRICLLQELIRSRKGHFPAPDSIVKR